ncbi:hypothetical protein EB234_30155 [Mesorhizobium japonicum R7A]|uniref:Uncharacterized protein n=1 Tax=Mesorhizobium loti R88b TaxID=935548 RepID=A0A6M7X2M8_RHILI|nr:hypothetical protein EB234_30155 [Mesorhizobium japonicum R7A]QKD05731.1 hypothetical protein EB235_33215 [Mesorhizobium loti R88b]
MNGLTLPLSGLSSVGGNSVVARFDGGMLWSDSGVLSPSEARGKAPNSCHIAVSGRQNLIAVDLEPSGDVIARNQACKAPRSSGCASDR